MPTRAPDSRVAVLPTICPEGWRFFPVRDGEEKKPLTKRWGRVARSDPERLRKWALTYREPELGWGLACEPSGVVVVDVDPRNGGSWEGVADLPETLVARTPGGGWHLFYRGTVPSRGGWRVGVDVKSRGGFVVVPSTGSERRWFLDPDVEIAELPGWMAPGPPPEPPSATSPEGGRGGGRGREYGRAALEGEIARVRAVGEGQRNETVYRAAYRIGQLVTQGDLTMAESEAELESAGTDTGLSREETHRAVANGLRDGSARPRVTVESSEGGGGSSFFTKKGALKTATVCEEVTRDAGGERDVVWGTDGCFWSYQDGLWQPWPGQSVIESRMALLLGDGYKISQVSSVESYAKTVVPRLEPQPDPEVINFCNGMVDVTTGELRPHDRWRFPTVQLAVDYVPGEDTSEFDAFLASVVPEDAIPVVWEVLAYGLMSGNPFEKAIMLVGPERSGKGTTLGVLQSMLGKANYTAVPLHQLARERFAGSSLLSMTANICADIDNNHIDQPAVIKSLTGGDPISAERKGRDRFTFVPWATLFFGANLIPTTTDTSSAFANRWVILPFSYSHADHVDPFLKPRMMSEPIARAVASKAVRDVLPGLLERGRFSRSRSTDMAHAEFQGSLSSMEMWIYECCTPGEQAQQLQHLYQEYRDWCEANGHTPASSRKLGQTLTNHFEKAAGKKGKTSFYGWKVEVESPD